jgi:EAL domain-containing protein (putative c-di-GMP-specific phosphodiesterase class I)
MCAVIDLGVDYIQGYYTGKPSANPIQEIDSEIKKQILSANPLITW